MARIASRQIAGYYPTPKHLLPAISSVLRWPEEPEHTIYLFDPCAGDGEAIETLRDQWVRQWAPDVDERRYYRSALDIHACELEAERAEALATRLSFYRDKVHHGDAFLLHPLQEGDRATVLFLNPPYDQDPEHDRMEQRFLARFTEQGTRIPSLYPGSQKPRARQDLPQSGQELFLARSTVLSASSNGRP